MPGLYKGLYCTVAKGLDPTITWFIMTILTAQQLRLITLLQMNLGAL